MTKRLSPGGQGSRANGTSAPTAWLGTAASDKEGGEGRGKAGADTALRSDPGRRQCRGAGSPGAG